MKQRFLTCLVALLFFAGSVFARPEASPLGDPWIHQVYQELYKREPNAFELNIRLYNNGSWNNYDELKRYVQAYQSAASKAAMQIKVASLKNDNSKVLVGINVNGVQKAVALVSTSDGRIVAAGGGNVVAAGGANIVASGGDNIQINNMAGISFGNRYVTQSAGTQVVPTSGAGALIIR